MLVKTEAIVLKSMKYRDTSKIVTFFTKEYGKLKGIAKGARTAKNKFGASLESITRSMLLIYKKEHHDLHLISQCDALDSYRKITDDLNRMANALAVLELVDQVTHDEERNPKLYELIVETLNVLASSIEGYDSFLQAFRLRLSELFGYMPNFDVCGRCGDVIDMASGKKQFAFQIARGAVFCNRCYSPDESLTAYTVKESTYISCSAPALQILKRLLAAKFKSLNTIKYNVHVGNEIDNFLRLYLRYHFDGLKPSKSREILQQFNLIV